MAHVITSVVPAVASVLGVTWTSEYGGLTNETLPSSVVGSNDVLGSSVDVSGVVVGSSDVSIVLVGSSVVDGSYQYSISSICKTSPNTLSDPYRTAVRGQRGFRLNFTLVCTSQLFSHSTSCACRMADRNGCWVHENDSRSICWL